MAKQKSKEKNQKTQGVKHFGMTNYPIGDFLIKIKNAALARNRKIETASTKLVKSVAKVMEKEGILEEVKEEKGSLQATLAYRKKEPFILDLKLVSSPGLRVYKGVDELEKKKGPSTYIVSTPKGVMSSREAIKNRVGGEVIVEIW